MRTYKSEKFINYTDCMIQQQTREKKNKKTGKIANKKIINWDKKATKEYWLQYYIKNNIKLKILSFRSLLFLKVF